MAANAAHPSTETLQALGLGQLPEGQAEAILNHLRICSGCRRRTADLFGADFLARLRDAHPRTDTSQPERTASPRPRAPEVETIAAEGAGKMAMGPRTAAPRAPELETTGPVRLSPVAGASTSWSPETFPAPFGRYQLLQLLGKGGMGAVYLAHDSQLDRPVALKVPHFESADGPKILERFYREARAAATVLHPNICPVHDVGEIDGTPYLTMAYVEGKPLAEHAAERPLSGRQSALLVRKLARAVQEAHQRGVIHRDLKPANIMIDRRGEPIIMDFGLARRLRGAGPRLTQLGALLGTPAYMSPEQVSGALEATGPASDVYSLGVIFYELLTGRLPFSGDPATILAQVVLDEPTPPSQVRKGTDPELERICLKAMAKKVEDRYESMAHFAAALTGALRASGPKRRRRPPERPSPPRE
jgi:serine/threonine protein kinase